MNLPDDPSSKVWEKPLCRHKARKNKWLTRFLKHFIWKSSRPIQSKQRWLPPWNKDPNCTEWEEGFRTTLPFPYHYQLNISRRSQDPTSMSDELCYVSSRVGTNITYPLFPTHPIRMPSRCPLLLASCSMLVGFSSPRFQMPVRDVYRLKVFPFQIMPFLSTVNRPLPSSKRNPPETQIQIDPVPCAHIWGFNCPG